ncbi:MAG: putative ABC transporter permease [Candidatus Saccharibacteria bacterium]|nr:putative ABC transporter permease [Candidatus Saccharibacteria bacterium]
MAELVLYFTIYAVFGYLAEVITCSVSQKRVVNRGFLFGPVVPIYGFGALIILFAASLFDNPVIIDEPLSFSSDLSVILPDFARTFLLSLIACSVLEYFTSLALEKIFKVRWWDYSVKEKIHLNGRICLKNSLLFGLGGVVIVHWLHPLVARAVHWLSPTARLILAIVFLTLFLLDTFVSVAAVKRAVKVTDFGKIVGDQTNEIKRQCTRMLGQFVQLWRGADPRILARRAHEEFEKRQKMLTDRFNASMKRRQARFEASMRRREARFKNLTRKKGK